MISQAAGLHTTIKWEFGISELEWVKRASNNGIQLQPLSYYEHSGDENVRGTMWCLGLVILQWRK